MSESEAEQPEPTMEEILTSIRRIISEDGEETDASETEAAAEVEETAADEPAEEEPVEEAVLELTDVVDDEPVGKEPVELETEPKPESNYKLIPEELEPVGDDDPLVSDEPAEAASNTFSQLSGAVLVQGVTLDELVREMLKPMLKAWLDANLPQIVERLVEREISRLSGGKPRE